MMESIGEPAPLSSAGDASLQPVEVRTLEWLAR